LIKFSLKINVLICKNIKKSKKFDKNLKISFKTKIIDQKFTLKLQII
jgi:hypothetical protein